MSARVGNFATVIENKIKLIRGQAKGTCEAAKKGYEQITQQVDHQSVEMATVHTNSSKSFETAKREMEAIKVTLEGKLKALWDAIRNIEG